MYELCSLTALLWVFTTVRIAIDFQTDHDPETETFALKFMASLGALILAAVYLAC